MSGNRATVALICTLLVCNSVASALSGRSSSRRFAWLNEDENVTTTPAPATDGEPAVDGTNPLTCPSRASLSFPFASLRYDYFVNSTEPVSNLHGLCRGPGEAAGALQECLSAWCSCLGRGNWIEGDGATATSESMVASPAHGQCERGILASTTCEVGTRCARGLTSCFDQAAIDLNRTASSTTACQAWMDSIRSETAKLYSGSVNYTGTPLEAACLAESCRIVNESIPAGACGATLTSADVCTSPVRHTGTLVLAGSFDGLLKSATLRRQLIQALEDDLTDAFGFPAAVESIASGSLIVNYSLAVSPLYPALSAKLKELPDQMASSWLLNTLLLFSASGADALEFDVVSLSDTTKDYAGLQWLQTALDQLGGSAFAPPTPNPGSQTRAPLGETEACPAACLLGIAVGVVVLLVGIAAAVACVYDRRRRAEAADRAKRTSTDAGAQPPRHYHPAFRGPQSTAPDRSL